ncbi:MAG: HD domain-containing protein [Oscillospiraceae bacterium]|nr:HD domain-containing protein [Oscillospiraceae bacterium]
MIYTDLTKKALLIAYNAHMGQYDRSGLPYIFHPYHLAEMMEDEYSVCAALLHDTVEDTDMTIEDIRNEGFPEEIVHALELLTHKDGVDYFDYVRAIRSDPLAVRVKLADLSHNSDLTRLDNVSERDRERVKKYEQARRILLEDIGGIIS